MKLKRYSEFQKINEAPVNMDFYRRQEDSPFFNDDQKKSLKEIGFDTVDDNHATMLEGNFIIKALPEMATSGYSGPHQKYKWLSKVRINIYQIDKNGKTEIVAGKYFSVGGVHPSDFTSGIFINDDGRENGNPGVIVLDNQRDIVEFMVINIPTIGINDDKYLNL